MASETVGGFSASRNGQFQQPTRGALALHPRGATTTSARVNQATQLQMIVGLYERAQRYIFKVGSRFRQECRGGKKKRRVADFLRRLTLFRRVVSFRACPPTPFPRFVLLSLPFLFFPQYFFAFDADPPISSPLPVLPNRTSSFLFAPLLSLFLRSHLTHLPHFLSFFAGHQTHANHRRV